MNNLYETQRAMRRARKAAIQRGVIAVLDIGTSKIACFVLKFDILNQEIKRIVWENWLVMKSLKIFV